MPSYARAATMRLGDSAEDLRSLLAARHCYSSPRKPRSRSLRAETLRQDSAELHEEELMLASDGGSAACAAALGNGPATTPQQQRQQDLAARWDAATQALVASSTLPFLFLLLPQQILKNAAYLRAGNGAALSALSYWSYLTGMGGNSLLLSYFAERREYSAVLIQALGVLSSLAVLTQLLAGGAMPRGLYAAAALVVGTQAIMTGLKLSGALDGGKRGAAAWCAWQAVAGCAGLVLVPQALWSTFAGGAGGASLAPALASATAAAAALAAERAGRLPAGLLRGAWAALSAWTATLLFMLQPDPSSLSALSLPTILLATAGNALMVPRALHLRDAVWLTGATWGSLVFGWAQMLSLALGRAPATGARFLPLPAFALLSAALWGWLALVLRADACAKGLPSPWGSLHDLLRARPAWPTGEAAEQAPQPRQQPPAQ
eukprot:scaffold10.g2475.t1